MGKKSKTKKNKAGGVAHGSQQTSSAPIISQHLRANTVTSNISESTFANPISHESTPSHGWARELKYIEKELQQKNTNDPNMIFRAAKALRIMRQFGKLAKILKDVQSDTIIFPEKSKKVLDELEEECDILRKQDTCFYDPASQRMFQTIFENKSDMRLYFWFDHPTYSNLYNMQYAAATGDVRLLEKFVSLGDAIDFANDLESPATRRQWKVRKPPGSTPLLLALIGACCSRNSLHAKPSDRMRYTYESQIECAVQLVRLGADVDVRFHLPKGRDGKSRYYSLVKTLGMVGKSAKELAVGSGSELLVQTINLMSSDESKIELVNCKCGSRLPWKECHYYKERDEMYYIKSRTEEGKQRIVWRYSPLAPCCCYTTKRSYFKCCWEESPKPCYQDAASASLIRGFRPHKNQTFLNMDPDGIRNMGQESFHALTESFHPKSKIGTWDLHVYAGTTERIYDWFQWKDVHWNVPKGELLLRVKDWNEALEKYCDDEGLTGTERQTVKMVHTASPFAPCASISCDKIETCVKQFLKCSKCLNVAYCSAGCQRDDWKMHKKSCMPRGK